jgi:hypothetical protein
LHTSGLIKEAFQDQFLLGRDHSERAESCAEVISQLSRSGVRKAGFGFDPTGQTGSEISQLVAVGVALLREVLHPSFDIDPEPRDRSGQLSGTARGFSQPEGNAGRLPVRVFDADDP